MLVQHIYLIKLCKYQKYQKAVYRIYIFIFLYKHGSKYINVRYVNMYLTITHENYVKYLS